MADHEAELLRLNTKLLDAIAVLEPLDKELAAALAKKEKAALKVQEAIGAAREVGERRDAARREVMHWENQVESLMVAMGRQAAASLLGGETLVGRVNG